MLSHFVEPRLIQPTFLIDYPVELSPLAKRTPRDPELVERFEAFVRRQRDRERATRELNDPIDQRERFEDAVRGARRRATRRRTPMDEDYLLALEYGMPPTGGVGIGIDRLA